MAEAEIERRVEKHMDRLDRRLLAGEITQVLYDYQVEELRKWADKEIRKYPLSQGKEE